jgi:hypothetical protein
VMIHRWPVAILVFSSVLLLATVLGLVGCGAGGSTSSTLSPVPEVTTPPPSGGTTVSLGTTVVGGQTLRLTFLGPVSVETWRVLRQIVMDAADDEQRILDDVAKLAAGPPVEMSMAELDAVRGIGYTAGADTSQPIGIAVDDDGNQIMVFAFSVTGKPDPTTIVGFERQTNLVGLVEGPLPISTSTGNMTTVPSP